MLVSADLRKKIEKMWNTIASINHLIIRIRSSLPESDSADLCKELDYICEDLDYINGEMQALREESDGEKVLEDFSRFHNYLNDILPQENF